MRGAPVYEVVLPGSPTHCCPCAPLSPVLHGWIILLSGLSLTLCLTSALQTPRRPPHWSLYGHVWCQQPQGDYWLSLNLKTHFLYFYWKWYSIMRRGLMVSYDIICLRWSGCCRGWRNCSCAWCDVETCEVFLGRNSVFFINEGVWNRARDINHKVWTCSGSDRTEGASINLYLS